MVNRLRVRRRHRTDAADRSTIGLPFAEVLERAKAGADDATAVLYDNHVAMIAGYLRARGVSNPEDLTSEVFVGMVRNLHTFEGSHAGFRSWLMMITHRRLQDHRRRQSASRVDYVDPAVLDQPTACDVVELSAVTVNQEIISAFGRLTEAQQEVLALRFVADVGLEEVAAITDRPVGAVKSLQHRALIALRQLLEQGQAAGHGG